MSSVVRPELRRVGKTPQNDTDVPTGGKIGLGQALLESCRRLVRDKAHGQLVTQVAGRLRPAGEQLEHLEPIFDPTPGGQFLTEHRLGLGVVSIGSEDESVADGETDHSHSLHPLHLPARACTLRSLRKNRPAGEGTRRFDHILLGIAAVHSEGVKLHELAGKILVEPPPPTILLRSLHPTGARSEATPAVPPRLTELGHPHLGRSSHTFLRGRLGVVEIREHRRMGGRFHQKLMEAPQHPGADGIALIGEQVDATLVVGHRNIEVVEPEIGEHCLELTLRIDSLKKLVSHQLAEKLPLVPIALLSRKLLQLAALLSTLGGRRGLPLRRRAWRRSVGRQYPRLLGLAADPGGRGEGLQYLVTRHAPDVEHRDPGEEFRVVDSSLQLFLEPGFEALVDNAIDLTGPGPISESIQEVGCGLTLGQTGCRPGQFGLGAPPRGSDRDSEDEHQSPELSRPCYRHRVSPFRR